MSIWSQCYYLAIISIIDQTNFSQKSNILCIRLLGTLARFFFYPQGNPLIPLKNCRSFMTHERAAISTKKKTTTVASSKMCLFCILDLYDLSCWRNSRNSVQTSILKEFFDSSPTFQRSSNVLWKITIRKRSAEKTGLNLLALLYWTSKTLTDT